MTVCRNPLLPLRLPLPPPLNITIRPSAKIKEEETRRKRG